MTIFDHNHPKFIKVIFNFPEFASACKKLAQSIHLFLIIHIHTTDFRFSWLKSGHRHFWPCPPNYYWVVINHALTHTHQHPAKNRPHSPTPTHTQPKKRSHSQPAKEGHTHPQPAKKRSDLLTPAHSQPEKVTPTHTQPKKVKNTDKKESHKWDKNLYQLYRRK